jgi:hypothetical protein
VRLAFERMRERMDEWSVANLDSVSRIRRRLYDIVYLRKVGSSPQERTSYTVDGRARKIPSPSKLLASQTSADRQKRNISFL